MVKRRVLRGQEPIDTWSYMKDKLKGKYVPPYYYKYLLDIWRWITQGNKSVKEYVTIFDEFFTRYIILGRQSDVQLFSQFCVGLRIDIEYELCKCELTDLKKVYALVQDLDALKLGYTFRSQNHQALTFKSTFYQYPHQVYAQTPTNKVETKDKLKVTLKVRTLQGTSTLSPIINC